jgi:prepilin-type N-terminal cleavage/methylation domain-containing protein
MKRARHTHGFTLIEVLVASAVTLLIVTVVAQMASGSLRAVSVAGSRIAATEKLDAARRLLVADLSRTALVEGVQTLTSKGDNDSWTLQLRTPAGGASSDTGWNIIEYQWNRPAATLRRRDNSITDKESPVVLTGVAEWEARWLESHGDDFSSGGKEWSETSQLPAALAVRARLTGVHEEGTRGKRFERGALEREFQWSMSVGGGG